MADNDIETWHGTTILSVRKNGKVVVAGDGQVTFGNTVMKSNARKVRPLGDGGEECLRVGVARHRVSLALRQQIGRRIGVYIIWRPECQHRHAYEF